jgi:hypothetical protein
MPLIKPRNDMNTLSLLLEGKEIPLPLHAGRGLAIALLFHNKPHGLSMLRVIGDCPLEGEEALNLLCLRYEVSSSLLVNDEITSDLRDCIFPNPLTLQNEKGSMIYIQSPVEYMADYRNGIALAEQILGNTS